LEAEFLASTMIIYIERDIATSFSSNSIIEDFKSLKGRKGALWLNVTFVFFFLYIIVDDKLYVTPSYILLLYCLDSIVMSVYFE